MTQSSNRILDEFAKLMTDAAGAAQGVKREVETLMKSQGERVVRSMELVSREEFEAVKAMAEKARAENERLEARLVALEARLGTDPTSPLNDACGRSIASTRQKRGAIQYAGAFSTAIPADCATKLGTSLSC